MLSCREEKIISVEDIPLWGTADVEMKILSLSASSDNPELSKCKPFKSRPGKKIALHG